VSHLDFYFDFSSPFAYLGSARIEAVVADAGATMTWKPLLLGALFKSIGTPVVPIQAFPASKRRHAMVDLTRWADAFEVPLQWPSRFPMNTVKPLRVALQLDDMAPWVHRVMRAYWAEDRDISSDDVLTGLCAEAGVDPGLVAETRNPLVKELLRDATQSAQDAGVFGVPTCVVDGQLYWGQDRLDFVRRALDGWNPIG
jgi:2-hydroxychromene-2-carboxylate isomerase